MTNKIFQIIVALILVVLLLLLANPFTFWMPEMATTVTLVVITALVAIWAGLIIQEKTVDEREVLHSMEAGRTAYLFGIAVLALALLFQGFSHGVDPWILLALGVMVVTRLVSRLYSDIHR